MDYRALVKEKLEKLQVVTQVPISVILDEAIRRITGRPIGAHQVLDEMLAEAYEGRAAAWTSTKDRQEG